MPPAPATPQQPTLTDEELKKALETLLFITDHPLGVKDLCKITGVKDQERVVALVGELKRALDAGNSAVQLLEVAEGYQMATRPSFAPFVRKLFADRMTMRLSTAAHETLSIIAYKQPITRAEIEEIRGVEVIAALETLLEKRLVKVVGRKETVGRPLMYGTTPEFLRHFGLASLEALPAIETFTVEPVPPVSSAIETVPANPETTEAAWESAPVTEPVQESAVSESEKPAEEIIRHVADDESKPEPEVEKPQIKNLWGDEAAEESK